MNEMKIWFLEQKVRQIELDMHKHDTKIMYMNEKIHNTNNTRKEENHHAPKEARKRTFQSNSTQNHTNNFPDDATDLYTRLDDLIVNMRGDETDFINDDGANSFNENEINQDHFLETPIPRKVRLKEAEQIPTPTQKLQKQTHSITDLQLEEIKQAEISESQKTSKGNNIIQQTNVQSATEQISANNTTASDPAPPACPTNTTTTLDTSSNSNPVTSSSPDATSIPTAKSINKKYAKDVEDDLKLFSSDITCENAAEKIQQLCTILNKNAEKQFKQPVKKRKKRKICWSPDIAAAAKTSKECYGKWKSLGKQKDPTQSAYIELKISKKVLRSTQRKSAAQKRNEKYERIMELNENDSEGFYQLIRKQRDPGNTCASAFIFKEEIINTDPEIREAWADYFYDLATPSENPNFDPIF
ncbi:Hypothetical predicted protein [Mytilus galloprovincialis]|uniref:Uncharacterized protein n=1 Tax=Mytilus galloprovincialis TaxID=29158 RepID=A0A8B6CIN3_MYTGA|nr:Hypothetical predicted protein [Mytilus galloprovincialis]